MNYVMEGINSYKPHLEQEQEQKSPISLEKPQECIQEHDA
jgi:hypothetical protein